LETARRCNIPLVVIVNNNSGFGQNLTGVRRISGNRPGRGEELIRFGPTDFTAVAKSFGVRGIRVEEPQQIAPALQQALAASEPVLIDVVTDLEPRAPEAWAPPRDRLVG
jgi:acetolactate synthase I/II/III large subunit